MNIQDWIGNLGAGALLALTVLLILTGRIVPRRSLDDARAERERWEAAWHAEKETSQALSVQVGTLIELGRTTEALLNTLVREGS
jgi:hypothetical protein